MNKAIIGFVSVLGIILSTMPLASAQSTFSWNFTCKGNKFAFPGIGSSATATWNRTVNGVAENPGSGSAFCGASDNSTFTVSGSGTVPTNANGITAFIHAQTGNNGCTVSTSKSLSQNGSVSINNLTVKCSGAEEGKLTFIEATFNLKS